MGVFLEAGFSGVVFALAGYGALLGGLTGLVGGPDLGVVRWAAIGACVTTGVTLSLAVLLLEPDKFKELTGPNMVCYLMITGVCIGVLAELGWQKGPPG
jgi:hypothetical protein